MSPCLAPGSTQPHTLLSHVDFPSAWLLLLLAALILCPALGLVSVGALLIGICVGYKLVAQKSVFSWKGVHRSMTQVLTPKVTLSRSLPAWPRP